jgi:hypothetical protein
VEGEAALEGHAVVRLSGGAYRNHSTRPGYDYRAARITALLAAPWGTRTLLGHAALAHQTVRHADPGDVRVTPTDHDTGALIALQLHQPLDPGRGLIVRLEWSRTEAGVRNDFHHRLGLGVQYTFRRGPS